MRIYKPKNHRGNKLIDEGSTVSTIQRLEKPLSAGTVTVDSSVIEDIENWELVSASILVGKKEVAFMPDTKRRADGSITIIFTEEDEQLDFKTVVLSFKRINESTYEDIELKIKRLMDKTEVDAKDPEYDQPANLAKWSALGQEAYDTDPEKYSHANETSLSTDFEAGPVVDDCLISIESLNKSISIADGVTSVVWVSDLPSFTTNICRSMFNPGPANLEWRGKLPNLVDASHMFSGCSGLTEWSIELPVLQNAEYMFHSSGLTSWTVDLPESLTNTHGMFMTCDKMTSWAAALPASLTNTAYMFAYCHGLTSWTVDLPAGIQRAESMFYYCTGLKTWTVALPAGLQNTSNMFGSCTGLTSFTGALPASLTNASSMFWGCTGLTEWTIDLPAGLQTASGMFAECRGLTSWTVDLPAGLQDAKEMFWNCTRMTSWTVDLPPSLQDASRMFYACKLDYASVEKIATSIPTKSGDRGLITIGVASADYANAKAAFNATMVNKNWTVTWQSNS